jgi:hypothetical protein
MDFTDIPKSPNLKIPQYQITTTFLPFPMVQLASGSRRTHVSNQHINPVNEMYIGMYETLISIPQYLIPFVTGGDDSFPILPLPIQ